MNPEESDRGVDAVASFLRVWARHAFNLPTREAAQTARELEAWASHLLLGVARPGAAEGDEPRGPLARRDWAGVRTFIAALRGEEADYVRQALSDYRSTVHGLVSRVREAIAEERVLDGRLAQQLEQLRAAAGSNDLHALKRAAEHAADAVSAVLDSHRARQAEQETEMSARMAAMSERLQTAEQLAEEDPLTGLVNRRGFDAELAKAVGLADQFKLPSSLLMIDLDHFKAINDRYGHPGGDAALRAAANVLTRSFPRRGDCVARYGGEEFAVVLRDSRSDEAQRIAARFLEVLRAHRIVYQSDTFQLTASIGIAELRIGESSAAWVARADTALYAAKQDGRDRTVVG